MSTSNTNWRAGNERRVNLAMTAELALGNGVNKNATNMQYNQPPQGTVPRVRGGFEGSANTNDILGTYQLSGNGGPQSNRQGFGYSEENKDFGGYKSSATSGLPPRGYNPNNEFNSYNSGLSANNNITNQYKPTGGKGSGFDSLDNFQSSGSNTNIQAESNGFKVQRVRGVQQTVAPNAIQGTNNPNNQFGMQTFGGGNNAGSSNTQSGGFGLARNNSKKDENSDIDFQTRQLKQEIDSLDLKLGQKNVSGTNIGNNNNYNANNYSSNIDQQQNNAFKSSATNFGSNNNINTALTGSGKNFYSNSNSDSNSNQFNSTSTGTGTSLYGNNGFGISFGSSNSSNNINNTNNNYNHFGPLSSNNNNNAIAPNNLSAQQLNNTLTNAINNNNNNNRLPPRGRPPMGPTGGANNFEETFGGKNENAFESDSKKAPVNNESGNKNANNEVKEFSTGTYDPSNILGQNRQGRMRSLGRKDANNSHEEKAAQATGSKNLPDQEVQLEEFLCPEGCGRTFNKKALAKHIPNCKKHFQPKKEDDAKEQPKQLAVNLPPKNAVEDKKQQKPPKAVGKKPGSKEVQSRPEQKDSKNEALRKLKEQKKKEILEQKQQEKKADDELVNEPDENEFF